MLRFRRDRLMVWTNRHGWFSLRKIYEIFFYRGPSVGRLIIAICNEVIFLLEQEEEHIDIGFHGAVMLLRLCFTLNATDSCMTHRYSYGQSIRREYH